ncbi:aspartyl protease family protein 1-like [Bidens hawaiensis]|uniref:aspartyl protease family protein 1-like n=1 Tax=Bidens hawaiensis TaxID=980011 RepID=UPI00404A00DE
MGSAFDSILLFLASLILVCSRLIDGFGTFGFDIHHRYSDRVKGILDIDDRDLPHMGSVDYYAAMAHRDRLFHRRRLADATVDSSLAFLDGNETYLLPSLGFLHYANVSVGTPSLWFLVALDTGSDLFWIPCDCRSCVKALATRRGRLDFNIYSPNASTTSQRVPCNSTSCRLKKQCSARPDICPYQVNYLSSNTLSTGILVEDNLHLITEDSSEKPVDAKIKFGCGMIQTGSFLDGAAPNGLFGLGIENLSVPSILASSGVTANSFSMCFGPDGAGRINFGDKGTSDQGETPLNLDTSHRTYISMTQIVIGDNVTNVDFTAIYDTGTSFTLLNDPAYTIIGESFASQIKESRSEPRPDLPFEYCYDPSSDQEPFEAPFFNLTMKGGDQYPVTDPFFIVPPTEESGGVFCVGILKSEDVNIIGQNFMTGYRVVFDREKNVFGWKASNCYNGTELNTLPISPRASPSGSPSMSVGPEATARNGSPNPSQTLTRPGSAASTLSYTRFVLVLSVTNFLMFVLL